jgi:hypothetical protein
MYQLLIGFLVIPTFVRAFNHGVSDWRLLPFFVLVLAAVRVVPAVARHVLPFSSELQTRWFNQRVLAKRYDSYQWRKLFWFGLGLSGYVALFDRAGRIDRLLALGCLLAGGLGLLAWRRVTRTRPVSAVVSAQ